MTAPTCTIVVGVVPDQPVDVLRVAADFAERFGARLECVTVDSSSLVAGGIEASWVVTPIDPKINEDLRLELERQLHTQVAAAIGDRPVEWSARAVIGVPANQLDLIAKQHDAVLIMLGTREPGIRGTLHELISGSVAAQLTHRQRRPVVVVPLHPSAIEARAARR